MAEDVRLACEAGTLEGSAGGWCRWLCDCERCEALLAADPARLVVVKGSAGRAIVPAGDVLALGADGVACTRGLGYVREVFTARRAGALEAAELYRMAAAGG